MQNENELVVSDQERELAAVPEENAARAPALGIRDIKAKNGELVLDGLRARELNVVILDYAYFNAYFEGDYAEGSKAKPVCFATHAQSNRMAPRNDVPKRQAENCADCWANQWESDGTGKACRNHIRLVMVLPARTPDGYDGILLGAKLAPTSIKPFHGLVNQVEGMRKRALRSVTVRISIDPASSYPKFMFDKVEPITDPGLINLILGYPVGPDSAIRRHLLRAYEDTKKLKSADDAPTYDDLPPPTDADAPPPMDEEIPF
jgi:hypothetical protein